MKTIKVDKEALAAELKTNRATHRALYEKAFAIFSAVAIETLQAALLEAKTGRGIQLHFGLPVPSDHTADYDRALKMVAMSVENVLELTEAEFQQLVMDDWQWKHQFVTSNAHYGVNG